MASTSSHLKHAGQLCLIIIATFASCGTSQNYPPALEDSQSLNVALWVEWPVVRYGWEQVAHVVVTDEQDQPVSGATVLGKFIVPENESRFLVFPLTDHNGYTSILIPNPPHGDGVETRRIDVQSTWSNSYGRSWTEYQLRP